MKSSVTSALFGVILVSFLSISIGQANAVGSPDSSNYETAENGGALDFEVLLQENLEEMRELKNLIRRYLANPPPNFHKRAQFLRLGR
ncbi:unnamed protein product [Rodentolepis nana]|uniref:Corticotropin-releasing factor domain-containing protein n=1 Tax=Rodentolepis nana TaxID=102285 RepID=A0A0R3TCQ9_RODNA|nr:unnamed protein product [Rodentolepis nana]